MRRAIALLISAIFFVGVLVVGVAPKTQAQTGDTVTLFSPMLPSQDITTQQFDCWILNAGSSAETVTIELFSFDGVLVRSNTVTLLPPGQASVVLRVASIAAYCKFTVPKGNFRASISIVDFSTTPAKVLAALPAF